MSEQKPMRENVMDAEYSSYRKELSFLFLKERGFLLLKLNNICSLQNFYNIQKQNYKEDFKNPP